MQNPRLRLPYLVGLLLVDLVILGSCSASAANATDGRATQIAEGTIALVAAALGLLVAVRIVQALRPDPPGRGPRHAGRPGKAAPIYVEVTGMYKRRRFAALCLMHLGAICATLSVVHTWGWADIPGGMIAFVVATPLLLAGSMLLNAARYAEGERRREAHRRSSSSASQAD